MNVQLLLALALVGPFCAFTHASPTERPKDLDGESQSVPDVTDAPAVDLTAITGPPATEPKAVQQEVPATEGAAATEAATATEATTAAAAAATEVAAEVATDAALPTNTSNTVEIEVAATATASPLVTDPPAVNTTDPSHTAEDEAGTEDAVVVEEESDEGMSSGQVVGVVIGVLLAVVIAIAVGIAVVRRMGKYSP